MNAQNCKQGVQEHADESSWYYVVDHPDLIEEIIDGEQKELALAERAMRLIELVEFSARVDYAPMDTEVDKRAIQLGYGKRSKAALLHLVESQQEALNVLTDYLLVHRNTQSVVEVRALLSVLEGLNPGNALPETLPALARIAEALDTPLFRPIIKLIIRFADVDEYRDLATQYLLRLLDLREHRFFTLEALAVLHDPSWPLVDKVSDLADPRSYDAASELSAMPEEERRFSPSVADMVGQEYISEDWLIERIEATNRELRSLAQRLLDAWHAT